MKHTIFNNNDPNKVIDPNPQDYSLSSAEISHNIKSNHKSIVESYLQSNPLNTLLNMPYPTIDQSEESLSRKTRRTLAQLRTNKSPILLEYLNKINPTAYPNPACPLCHNHTHNTNHLFSCPSIPTTLTPMDLWNNQCRVEGCCPVGKKLWSECKRWWCHYDGIRRVTWMNELKIP